MSLQKEIFKAVSWTLTGAALLASAEVLFFPDLQDPFLTIATLGMMLAVSGFSITQALD